MHHSVGSAERTRRWRLTSFDIDGAAARAIKRPGHASIVASGRAKDPEGQQKQNGSTARAGIAMQLHGGNPVEIMVRGRRQVKLQLAARTREAPKACKQGREMRRVMFRSRCELQSQPIGRLNVPHDRLYSDLAFLDQKIQPGLGSY